MNLFQIEAEIESAINNLLMSVDEETGEVNEELANALEELQAERDVKVENIACYIKNLKAESAALKNEIDTFTKRKKSIDNKIERLTEYLCQNIKPEEKFKFARATVSFRRSSKVEIFNEEEIPAKFCELKYETKIDKRAITEAIKAGEDVSGCMLIDSYSLQIK